MLAASLGLATPGSAPTMDELIARFRGGGAEALPTEPWVIDQ
jgi:hypothetical protein